MKDVINPPYLRQFELISLFAYWVKYLKKTKKLGFQLAILLSSKMLAIQLNLVA